MTYLWGYGHPNKGLQDTLFRYEDVGWIPGAYGTDPGRAAAANAAAGQVNCGGSVVQSVGGRLHRSLPRQTIVSKYEPRVPENTPPTESVKTETNYDACGNAVTITSTHIRPDGNWSNIDGPSTGESKRTVNQYDNVIDGNRWHLGRLRRSTVTSTKP